MFHELYFKSHFHRSQLKIQSISIYDNINNKSKYLYNFFMFYEY